MGKSKKNKRDLIGDEKYTMGELSQLARRKMMQKNHGDDSKYNRKQTKRNVWKTYDDEEDDDY